MSKTSSSAPPFNGANCNVISSNRLPSDYYNFCDDVYCGVSESGFPEHQSFPFSEYLGIFSDYSLSSLISAGINPQAVSMGIGSRLDGISELNSFIDNNPDKSE